MRYPIRSSLFLNCYDLPDNSIGFDLVRSKSIVSGFTSLVRVDGTRRNSLVCGHPQGPEAASKGQIANARQLRLAGINIYYEPGKTYFTVKYTF
ncbi:MAG: hypothetical protein NUV80_03955 [Candidatus Berkelbacteria bacterium]|nr:hypothetical protein [Candidatus Berkelbacteria bacterium]